MTQTGEQPLALQRWLEDEVLLRQQVAEEALAEALPRWRQTINYLTLEASFTTLLDRCGGPRWVADHPDLFTPETVVYHAAGMRDVGGYYRVSVFYRSTWLHFSEQLARALLEEARALGSY